MIAVILAYIFALISILIGYYLGTKRSVKEDITKYWKVRPEFLKKDELKVGPIRRPSAKNLNEKAIPEHEKAGLDAMEQTLKNIPELNE